MKKINENLNLLYVIKLFMLMLYTLIILLCFKELFICLHKTLIFIKKTHFIFITPLLLLRLILKVYQLIIKNPNDRLGLEFEERVEFLNNHENINKLLEDSLRLKTLLN